MILQELVKYYDRLVEKGKLQDEGWESVRVSYALQIDENGDLRRVIPLKQEENRGKKTVQMPQSLCVPARIKRSVKIIPNFLCDNSTYMLGKDKKENPERAAECFKQSCEMHIRLLQNTKGKAARSLRNFFVNWDPEKAEENEILAPYLEEITGGENIVFMVDTEYVHEDNECREAWNAFYTDTTNAERMRCLVTGKTEPIARLHPSIKGIVGGQSSGTTLVSFNAPAFESYGRDGAQGLNAPVSVKAAFAYSAALKYMIETPGHHLRLSDQTIVFWAENGEDDYAELCSAMFGEETGLSLDDLNELMKNLASGREVHWKDEMLNPGEKFFILGLSPNAARLSVRYFLQSTIGEFAENLSMHHERMKIVRPPKDERAALSFWQLLNETVNQKSQDKKPLPLLSGDLVRSVMLGLPYPDMLFSQVELRIRADHSITRGRAGIIKAVLLKKNEYTGEDKEKKEALTVELNEETKYAPYVLGRLFAVLEDLQQAANPGINATIKDRFFNSACATPAVVFPQLIKLSQAHLKKLNPGLAYHYSKKIGEMMGKMEQDYPQRLNLQDQGIYQLGYYHQKWTRKKEEN